LKYSLLSSLTRPDVRNVARSEGLDRKVQFISAHEKWCLLQVPMSACAVPPPSLEPTKEFLQIMWTIYFPTVSNGHANFRGGSISSTNWNTALKSRTTVIFIKSSLYQSNCFVGRKITTWQPCKMCV